MAIVVPEACTFFGDATGTRDPGSLRKYVLAQFRSGADLAWVADRRLYPEEVDVLGRAADLVGVDLRFVRESLMRALRALD